MKEIWIQTIAVAGYSFTATIAFMWRVLSLKKQGGNKPLFQKGKKKI